MGQGKTGGTRLKVDEELPKQLLGSAFHVNGCSHVDLRACSGFSSENRPTLQAMKGDTVDEEEPSGPKPMLPYSSMFILSPTNP